MAEKLSAVKGMNDIAAPESAHWEWLEAKVRALMSEYGLTLADLGGKAAPAPARAVAGKVPPKYRNPETGETWSGRGLQPNWLKAALAGGARLDDFKL